MDFGTRRGTALTLRTKHREFISWVMTPGALDVVEAHGNKVTTMCLFWFDIQADGTIQPSIADISSAMEKAERIKQKWPHIRWLLTLKNDGIESRIRPILLNQNGEQDRLVSELHRILNLYRWADGVDADLERLPNDIAEKNYALYERIYREVKNRDTSRFVHIDLPPMTGPRITVGPEKWCEYERLKNLCDTAQIMTYGYAWAGSAPGSTSPLDWQRKVMEYASTAFDPEQVYMGVAAYGHRWQVYDYPKNLERGYRGYAGSFAPFLQWMLGDLSHTDQYRGGAETQAYIPFAAFYEEQDAVFRLPLHIYDYPGVNDEDETNLVKGTYGGSKYFTAYGKKQKVVFDGEITDKGVGDATVVSGAMEQGANSLSPRKPGANEAEGYAKWSFSVPESGTYDVVAQVQFPWFDKQKLHVKIDGASYTIGAVAQQYPYHDVVHWWNLSSTSLSAGTHTFELFGSGSQHGTVFYGFKVCESFSETHEAGRASFTLRPRKFLDRNKQSAWPHNNKFRITLEALRRPPENVLVFYDDFRDWRSTLPSAKYTTRSGSWKVEKDPADNSSRPYSWVAGGGQFEVAGSFQNITVRGNVKVTRSGKGGVSFGSLWYCLNMTFSGGRYELYQGDTLLGYRWPNGSLSQDTFYPMKMVVKETEVICYLGATEVIRHALAQPVGQGSWGIKSDVTTHADLLVGSDSYWMYPQESMVLTLPDGSKQELGRIPREVEWDEKWGTFRTDGDEYDTRTDPPSGMSKTISAEWDYLHSASFSLLEGDHPISVQMADTGVWLQKAYLGDADGFSIAVFPFAQTILRQGDIAAYEFGIRGIGMWAVGQEDPQLWHMLVDHV